MQRNIAELTARHYDLVIVGGGIFGVCAAWEAALRGLTVALVERGDFCQATSANHFKLVHGGIRYLQHADIPRIRESSRERNALLRIAPHLVHPLPIIVPTYGHGMKGKEVLRMGFGLYDALTWDRNRGIRSPMRRIPHSRFLSSQETLGQFPGLRTQGLTGGAIFSDAQFYNPARLAISFLRSAVASGAVAGNYLEVTGFSQTGERIVGVQVCDVLTNQRFEIQSKMVLNTAGPWAHQLLDQSLGLQLEHTPSFSRDVGLVVARRMTDTYGLACITKTQDAEAVVDRGGRHLFLLPWRNYTLIGVWHVVHNGLPDAWTVTDEELQAFVDDANEAYPALNLHMDEVSMVNAGLILFGDKDQEAARHSFGKRSILIDHARTHHLEGLITLIGVRATTARGMAEKAVAMVCQKLVHHGKKADTRSRPIYGGDIPDFGQWARQAMQQPPDGLEPSSIQSLVRNYGSAYREVTKYLQDDPALSDPLGHSGVIGAEIVHAVREEMAQKLADVVLRRTELGTGEYPGDEVLQRCAAIMAQEMGWDDDHVQRELQEVRAFYKQRRCLRTVKVGQ